MSMTITSKKRRGSKISKGTFRWHYIHASSILLPILLVVNNRHILSLRVITTLITINNPPVSRCMKDASVLMTIKMLTTGR